MSTFAYFLTTLLIGGLLCICAYLVDRVIKLEKRMAWRVAQHRAMTSTIETLENKIRHLEAF